MTKLDWLSIVETDGLTKPRIKNFGYGLPKFDHYLHTCREVGRIKTGKVGETGNHGATCMFIGSVNNHERNFYCMCNPVTNQVSDMRNVIFLQRMFYHRQNSNEVMKEPTVTL